MIIVSLLRFFLEILLVSYFVVFLGSAELPVLGGNIEYTANSSEGTLHENETEDEIVRPVPIVPPIVGVIHGKVNSVLHEIRGSIDDIPVLLKTEVTSEDDFSSATPVVFQSVSPNDTDQDAGTNGVERRLVEETGNLTAPESPPSGLEHNTSAGPQDDIPSFSEWAKKHMAEAGRNKGENLTAGSGGLKLRVKNYASPDCGSKVVASNPEALSPGAILSSTRDDYMLNPCNVRIWFVVELCEPIQLQRIEIANFELFSSSPQEISIYTSDRFPTREWTLAGGLVAKDERTVQSFPLPGVLHFVKYLKVELHSHYGTEHYCPISLFRAYGTSEMEVLETVDGGESEADLVDEEDNVGKERDLLEEVKGVGVSTEEAGELGGSSQEEEGDGQEAAEGGEKTNLFGTAKAAVLSIVKKAASVLGKGGHSSGCGQAGLLQHGQFGCLTPGYSIVCNNCDSQFYSKLYEVLCCRGLELQCLLTNPFIYSVIAETQLCAEIGLDWDLTEATHTSNSSNSTSCPNSPKVAFLKAFLPSETIAALCNYLAVTRKKVCLNTTHEESLQTEKEKKNTTVPDDEESSEKRGIDAPEEEIKPTKALRKEESASLEEETPVSAVKESEPEVRPTEVPKMAAPSAAEVALPTGINQTNGHSTHLPGAEGNDTGGLTLEAGEESVAVDSLALDSLFPDPEDPEETRTTQVPVQKESVFVRLANRIKALEVNMSLSSQYLEELSRRYKKQVEELQRSLGSMMEERRVAAERESMQGAQLAALYHKVETLSAELLAQRESWLTKAGMVGQHGVIVLLEVVGFLLVVWTWRRLGAAPPAPAPVPGPPRRRHSDQTFHRPARGPLRLLSSHNCLPQGENQGKDLLTVEAPKRKVSREGVRKRKRRRKSDNNGQVELRENEAEWKPLEPDGLPEYVRTALWARGKRSSQTQTSASQEALAGSVCGESKSASKKTGAFRKIVKKLF